MLRKDQGAWLFCNLCSSELPRSSLAASHPRAHTHSRHLHRLLNSLSSLLIARYLYLTRGPRDPEGQGRGHRGVRCRGLALLRAVRTLRFDNICDSTNGTRHRRTHDGGDDSVAFMVEQLRASEWKIEPSAIRPVDAPRVPVRTLECRSDVPIPPSLTPILPLIATHRAIWLPPHNPSKSSALLLPTLSMLAPFARFRYTPLLCACSYIIHEINCNVHDTSVPLRRL